MYMCVCVYCIFLNLFIVTFNNVERLSNKLVYVITSLKAAINRSSLLFPASCLFCFFVGVFFWVSLVIKVPMKLKLKFCGF